MNNKIIYAGKILDYSEKVKHRYYLINDDNTLGELWTFSKKIFIKGTIGSVYFCEITGTMISYKKSSIPTHLISIDGILKSTSLHFSEINDWEFENKRIETIIRNSIKQSTKLDLEIKEIADFYKKLKPSQRAFFIADLVYKITG
jgi:hypothetical protein